MNFIIALMMSFSFLVFAQKYNPIKDEVFNAEVESIKQEVNQTFDSITLNLENLIAVLPDYEIANKSLINNIKSTRIEFLAELDKISNMIKSELEVEYAELSAIENLYTQNKNSSIKKLLDDKKIRVNSNITNLESRANDIYSRALYKLYSINNNYIYPMKIYNKINSERALFGGISLISFTSLPIFYFVFPPLALATAFTGSVSSVIYTTKYNDRQSPDIKFRARDDDGYLDMVTFDVTLSNGAKFQSHDAIEITSKTLKIKNSFKDCKTAGCVYLLAQSIRNYTTAIKKLNNDLTVLKVIKLKRVTFSKKDIRKSINKISEKVASTLPIAEFNKNESNDL